MAYRTAIATVCLSGTLEEKLPAAAAAGFDGVEIFEPDLIATPLRPAEIRKRCDDLGLAIDLYQPFRDFEATGPDRHAANLRRAERKFDVMEALGVRTLLACSSVDPAAIDDDALAAQQLHALAERAGDRGLRIAYEALAWGTHVSTWDRSWQLVLAADHPALGLCLDSFHILSQNSAVEPIRAVPGDKVFFLQLADAPPMDMDVLQWSRHHRLFPGQGTFDLVAFLSAVLATGYAGPLSLEVFNDVFRQSAQAHTAVDAHRSLVALVEAVEVVGQGAGRPAAPQTRGFAFGEVDVDGRSGVPVASVLAALGFAHVGQHRSKPAQLWQQQDARIVLNWGNAGRDEPGQARIAAMAVQTADAPAAVERAAALLAPVLPRRRGAAEADLPSIAAPDGLAVFLCGPGAGWTGDFLLTGDEAQPGTGITRIDHIALTQPFDVFDEAALFYRSVLGLQPQTLIEVAAPVGLQRSRAMRNGTGSVRIPLSAGVLRGAVAAGVAEQHIAFACDDIFAAARSLRSQGAPLLAVPENYYDDLDARLAPEPDLLAALREHDVLYDQNEDGEFFQLYTEVVGRRVFFEIVQRVGDYDGYGVVNTPVHLAAHHRLRIGG